MRSKIAVVLSLLVLLVGLANCGGGGSAQSTPPPGTSVVVTPANVTVYRGATAKFKAQVIGLYDQTVTWSVDNSLGTIDDTGLYTAPKDASGSAHIVANSKAIPGLQGSVVVVVAPIQVEISPATITLSPGGTQTFTATVNGSANSTVTWTIQEAAGGSVTDAGFYTAPSATGFYQIVATSVADATLSDTATITVTTSSGRFTPTGSMQTARGSHTATLLANGKVLMAGGSERAGPLCLSGIASAELYDSVAGSFAPTASMNAPRYAHTATLLLNGEVLVTGGFGSGVDCEDLGTQVLTTAEIYDPSNASFKMTGNMAAAREGHTATLLPTGKVLVTGGNDESGVRSATAELYDPAIGKFTSTGNMESPRSGHTATLLGNGRVLIVGGVASSSSNPIALAEIYDPATQAFTPTGNMITARSGHAAILLPNGRVLIIGGGTSAPGDQAAVLTAEIYDPSTGFFSVTGATEVDRGGATATLLSNGTVLVTGGGGPTAELYDPMTGSFSPTGSMEIGRAGHSATLLPGGIVLVAGGGSRFPLSSAELYK